MRDALRTSLGHVGVALREPEGFALEWHQRRVDSTLTTWIALGATAMAGTLVYGMTMGLGHGAGAVASKGALLTLAAGLAWGLPLPALYILNSLSGSRLRPTTTLLAALVTTSWGGLAMLASVPITWFFAAAVPDLPAISPNIADGILLGVHLLVFTGVGVSMIDVFGRVMSRLEPSAGRRPLWFLVLVGLIGAQLFYLFGLFF